MKQVVFMLLVIRTDTHTHTQSKTDRQRQREETIVHNSWNCAIQIFSFIIISQKKIKAGHLNHPIWKPSVRLSQGTL